MYLETQLGRVVISYQNSSKICLWFYKEVLSKKLSSPIYPQMGAVDKSTERSYNYFDKGKPKMESECFLFLLLLSAYTCVLQNI